MLFVTLEDLNDNMELLVFNDLLSKTADAWQENQAVLVDGFLSWKNRGHEVYLRRGSGAVKAIHFSFHQPASVFNT